LSFETLPKARLGKRRAHSKFEPPAPMWHQGLVLRAKRLLAAAARTALAVLAVALFALAVLAFAGAALAIRALALDALTVRI